MLFHGLDHLANAGIKEIGNTLSFLTARPVAYRREGIENCWI